MSLIMDLTGKDERYLETDKLFRVFKPNQLVDFNTPVFEDSIRVYLVSSGVVVELERDTDYDIPTDFIDDNSKSSAKLADVNFTSNLVTGIRMLKEASEEQTYTIQLHYQRLYPKQLQTPYLYGEPVEFTPELLMGMLTDISELKILNNRVDNVTTISQGEGLLFELDPAYSDPANDVKDEVQVVNVPEGKFLVRPKGGSFYKDSTRVYHVGSSTYLAEGKDYAVVGMNENKTKATTSEIPVYDFILIRSNIVGEICIDYHAFGGDTTIDNYTELLKQINNVIYYLDNVNFVSSGNLGNTDIMAKVFNRINKLEDNMRRLLGAPSYGDVTNRKTTLMKLFADNSSLHWYTIAELFKVDGDTLPCVSDTFMFRVQTQVTKFQFTAAVAVDLTNTTGRVMNVNILSENYPLGYKSFEDYANIDTIIRPQFRVVWGQAGNPTGAYLQLGFELKNVLEETVVVEDISGAESCWKLVDEVATVTTPQDDNFLLPNGNIWSSNLDGSYAETMLMPFKSGHLVWSGMHKLNQYDGWWNLDLEEGDMYLEPDTDISRITKIRANIQGEGGFTYPVDIHFNATTDMKKGHATFTHQDAVAYLNAELRRVDGALNLRIGHNVTAGVESNPLYLRDIVVYTC